MCALLRYCLENGMEALLNDLHPKYILPHLVKSEILTAEEEDLILSHSDISCQVKELCNILPTKGLSAFNGLIEALNKDDAYPWLADELLKHKKSALANPDEVAGDIDKQLAAGGVPFPANHLLRRKKALEDIRDKLREAGGRQWIALHGMMGSGKSVLAAEAVRDPSLFKANFENGVYWIPVGRLNDKSNLLYKMQILQDMLQLSIPVYSHSNVALNLPEKIHDLTRHLRGAVSKKKKLLLVLDDVWNDYVIKAFDLGCPVLVTTRDKRVLEFVSGYTDFTKLELGLDLVESKELLCMYMKTSPDLLPKEVEEIHQQFWGSPMVLSLVGAMMAPYGNDMGRWKDLHKKLKMPGRIFSLFRRRHPSSDESVQKNVKEIIKLSVESLDEEIGTYFRDLAIFQEDVYIPNQVLEVLWQRDRYDVEEILYEIVEKSLIQREKIPSRDTFAYAIHDLYLEFLKEECSDLTALHKKMIQQYKNICRTTGDQVKLYDYGLLLNDGYIYNFIGHHLQQAEEWSLFPEIFFDLGFVKNKLCIAGPSDLLNDFQLYKKGFENNLDELHDFENFIKRNAHLINEDTDIIQLALLEPPFSKVHERAKAQVISKPNKFYLEICNWHHVPECDELHISLHSKAVKCAVFCPDNRFVASAGEDTVVKICSSSSGRELESLTGHSGTINRCAFNASGDRLISSSSDGTVKVWNISIPSLARCLSQEKKRCSFGEIRALVNESDNKCLRTFREHHGEVLCCDFSPNDKLVVSGDSTGITLVWDPESGYVKRRFVGSLPSAVHCCAFSPDSRIVGTSSGGCIKLWDWSAAKCLSELNHDDEFVCEFSFTEDGRSIFSIAGESVWKWNVTEPAPLLWKKGINSNLCSCSLSPDEKFLALGTSPNNSITILNVDSKEEVTFLKKHKNDIHSINYSNDGFKLLSASSDCDIIIWNDIYKRLNYPVSLENNLSVQLSDELVIATSDHLNHIQVRSGYEGLLKCKSPPEDDLITACSLSHDCSEVVYGTKWGVVKIYNVNSGEIYQCLPSHNAQVTYIVHMKSCSSFITCSEDYTLRIWEDPTKYKILSGHTQLVVMCVLYNCDKKLLSCSADGTSIVWNTEKGEIIKVLNCHSNLRINFCDVSPDESLLATASVDCTIKLWSEGDGQILKTFQCDDCVRCCQFSPKSAFLVSGEDSGNVMVWDTSGNYNRSIGNHDSWVRQIRFSEDGKYFVSVADSIKFWDQECNLIQRLVLPGDVAYSLWACHDFTVFVILHNSILYILKSIF